ncbi:ATPase [Iocasia frigidifontis]|uniref:ATP synthase F(0) sector subunit c n=1 Tax=Iocasia fonsfrigidae TaxID=2682810 RepID=A0A8A7KDC8_9FIRM|nr:ATP synthase subunit C [Iocasia fonsfrigidae]QTL98105.1 ATPase [Iocasia fonsfrigidae]
MTTGLIIGSLIVLAVLGGGFSVYKFKVRWLKYAYFAFNITLLVFLFFWGVSLAFPHLVYAAEANETVSSGNSLGYLAAGLSVGIASIGAGIAVGIAGSAAIGAISEKPEILGRALIIIGLAEGIAIYGLIISIMILGRL